jgi:hypothetical protein
VIASASSRVAVVAAAALLAAACAGPAPAPQQALELLPSTGAYVPDDMDLALRDTARALLANRPAEVDEAIARVEAQEGERAARGEGLSGALPYALDARHALVDDPGLYRALATYLLERGDMTPELRARIAQEVADDPLQLADARIRDARTLRFGGAFNAVAEAAGRSLTNTVLLAYRLADALLQIAVAEHTKDPLTLPERQALRLWKQFVEQHPEAPETPHVVGRIEEAQQRWYRTQLERTVENAETALDEGDVRLGLALSERAVRYSTNEDSKARRLLAKAEAETTAERHRLTRSEKAELREDALAPEARELAIALLAAPPAPRDTIVAAAEAHAERDDALGSEARYAARIAEGELAARPPDLEEIADESVRRSPMARHASAEVESPDLNPYRYWKRARRADAGDTTRWVLFGPLADGPRKRPRTPRAVEWLLDLPAVVGVVTGLPQRIVRIPFLGEGRRSPAVFAARYLEREPAGEHADEVRAWLVAREEERGNPAGALAVAQAAPHPEDGTVARLRVQAAEQMLEAARKQPDLPTRVALLRRVGREYEGTPAAREAVGELRTTVREATPQYIRISKGFISENPDVVGPNGLALRGELLDGRPGNGELHPDGVALIGGHAIEISYLGPDGDPRDPPVLRRERVSSERMQRVVSALEEASLRNALVDSDYPVEYDADRDLFFERTRLGLDADTPAGGDARSSYAFRGLRERYGLVRKRESILPVELIVQGSFTDMALGAFPRIRMPRPTADAFLYE